VNIQLPLTSPSSPVASSVRPRKRDPLWPPMVLTIRSAVQGRPSDETGIIVEVVVSPKFAKPRLSWICPQPVASRSLTVSGIISLILPCGSGSATYGPFKQLAT
jgi:hypothetical protein